MHNFLLEAVSKKDQNFFAHLAGDVEEADDVEPEMYANVAGSNGDKDEDTNEFENEKDSAAIAFAEMGLESLNWNAA